MIRSVRLNAQLQNSRSQEMSFRSRLAALGRSPDPVVPTRLRMGVGSRPHRTIGSHTDVRGSRAAQQLRPVPGRMTAGHTNSAAARADGSRASFASGPMNLFLKMRYRKREPITVEGPVHSRTQSFFDELCNRPGYCRPEMYLRRLAGWPRPLLSLGLFHPSLRVIGETPELDIESTDEDKPLPKSPLHPMRLVLPHTSRLKLLSHCYMVFLPWLEDMPFPSDPPLHNREWPLITEHMLHQLQDLAAADLHRFNWIAGPSHFSNSAGLNVLALLLLLRPDVRQLYCLSEGRGFYAFLKDERRIVRMHSAPTDLRKLVQAFPGLLDPKSVLVYDAYPMEPLEQTRELSETLKCRLVAPSEVASLSAEEPEELTMTRLLQHMQIFVWSMIMPWVLGILIFVVLFLLVWHWVKSF